jgi:methionyl-tRNA synthetase
MSEMVLGLDATFSMDSFVKKYNSDLANDLGNLVSRVCTLISNNFDDKMPKYNSKDSILAKGFSDISMKERLDHFKVDGLIDDIMSFVRSVNGYMEKNQPWKIVKENKEAAGHVLYHAAESLRVAAIMLSPVMPEKSQEIMTALGATEFKLDWAGLKPGDKISKGDPIFPRIVQ